MFFTCFCTFSISGYNQAYHGCVALHIRKPWSTATEAWKSGPWRARAHHDAEVPRQRVPGRGRRQQPQQHGPPASGRVHATDTPEAAVPWTRSLCQARATRQGPHRRRAAAARELPRTNRVRVRSSLSLCIWMGMISNGFAPEGIAEIKEFHEAWFNDYLGREKRLARRPLRNEQRCNTLHALVARTPYPAQCENEFQPFL